LDFNTTQIQNNTNTNKKQKPLFTQRIITQKNKTPKKRLLSEINENILFFYLVLYGLLLFGLAAVSVVISSIGFGGSVVAIAQPIHTPMNKIATKAKNTGTAISQNLTSAEEPMLSQGWINY